MRATVQPPCTIMKENTQEVVFHFDELTEENVNKTVSVLSDPRNWHFVNDKGEQIDQDHCTFCFNDLGDYKQNCLQSEKLYNEAPEWVKDLGCLRTYSQSIRQLHEKEMKKEHNKRVWELIEKTVDKHDAKMKLDLMLLNELARFQNRNITPLVEAEIRSVIEEFNRREDVIASGFEYVCRIEENNLNVECYERY